MLPIDAQQCSIGFTIMQSIVGGLFGSIGFIINILAVRGAMQWYYNYKTKKQNDHVQKQDTQTRVRHLHR